MSAIDRRSARKKLYAIERHDGRVWVLCQGLITGSEYAAIVRAADLEEDGHWKYRAIRIH